MEQLDTLPTYDWSGIYRLEGDTLVLDAYVGAHTDHTHIPVGRGVCGTAVAENANQVIEDVRELSNYLSCSIHTRAEIVTLIYSPQSVVGSRQITKDLGSSARGHSHGSSSDDSLRIGLTDPSPEGIAPAGQLTDDGGTIATPIPTLPPLLREGEGLLGSALTESLAVDELPIHGQLPTSNFQLPTILGQIDIDSHTIGAFDASDEEFLTKLGEILAERWDD